MSFWSRRRRGGAEESPTAVGPTTTRLAVVEFWAGSHRTVAGVDLSQDLAEVPEDPSQPIGMTAGQAWTQLSVGEALLILPPPQVTDPRRRLHRPRQPVEITIGPFVVSGMAHVPPGAQAAGFLIRQTARFVPVTRASVRDTGLQGFEQRAEVVLVNMRRVDKILDVGLDQPDPLPSTEASAPIA